MINSDFTTLYRELNFSPIFSPCPFRLAHTSMAEKVEADSFVVPGQVIGSSEEFESGNGTFVRGSEVLSSLAGKVSFLPAQSTSSEGSSSSSDSKKLVAQVINANAKPTIVPKEKSVVLAQVTKVTPRFAQLAIVNVDEVTLNEYFPGTIRSTDIQTIEGEAVEVYRSFRPGDLVRAEVLSLGDSRTYYLTTAKPEYGVVLAKSISGHTMEAISNKLMQCPVSKTKEYRKVAKTS